LRRHLLGIIALSFLLVAAAIWYWSPLGYEIWAADCGRIGVILAVLWLAYHDLRHIPAWVWPAILVGVVIAARWPKYLLLLLPILILAAILRPRRRER